MTTQFDVSLDLLDRDLPPGVSAEMAVVTVRTALERLPGANWVSVEYCGPGIPRERDALVGDAEQIRVWPAGSSQAARGEPWSAVRSTVRAATLDSLASLMRGEVGTHG